MRHPGVVAAILAGGLASCGGEAPLEPARQASTSSTSVSAPSSLAATTISVGEIDLSWRESSTSVNGFQVYRSASGASWTLLTSLGATARTYGDAGLTTSTQYCYEVRAWQTARKVTSYSAFAGPACATTLTPPPPPIAAPSGVGAVAVREDFLAPYNSSVDVSWTDNSGNEDGFRIEEASSAAGPWTFETTVAANVTLVRWGMAREQPTCFRVIAFNSSAASNPSDPVCTVAPANPTGLTAVATDSGIDLAWSDNSAFEDAYGISRSDASGAWTDLATVPANTTSYTDAAVSADMTYTYRVQALKDGGASDYSNQAVAVLATSRPAAPTNLVAAWWADQEGYGWLYFDASWTDGSANEDGFRLESSADGSSGWSTYATTPGNTPQFSGKYDLWGGAAAFSACYRVIAFNAAGDSEPSNVFCTGWGEAPSDVVATIADAHSVDLSWTDNARFESGYWVDRLRMSDSVWEFVATLPPDATTCHDTGLISGEDYWYVISVAYPDNGVADYFNYGGVSVTMPP